MKKTTRGVKLYSSEGGVREDAWEEYKENLRKTDTPEARQQIKKLKKKAQEIESDAHKDRIPVRKAVEKFLDVGALISVSSGNGKIVKQCRHCGGVNSSNPKDAAKHFGSDPVPVYSKSGRVVSWIPEIDIRETVSRIAFVKERSESETVRRQARDEYFGNENGTSSSERQTILIGATKVCTYCEKMSEDSEEQCTKCGKSLRDSNWIATKPTRNYVLRATTLGGRVQFVSRHPYHLLPITKMVSEVCPTAKIDELRSNGKYWAVDVDIPS